MFWGKYNLTERETILKDTEITQKINLFFYVIYNKYCSKHTFFYEKNFLIFFLTFISLFF